QTVLVDALDKQVVVVNTLATANDFAVTFGCDHIRAQRQLGTIGVGLHVERLDRGWITVDDHRAVKLLAKQGLISVTEVAAPFDGAAFALQDRHRFVVTDARKRRLYRLQWR